MSTPFRPPPKPPPLRRGLTFGALAAVNNCRLDRREPPGHRRHRDAVAVKACLGVIRAVKA